MATILAVDDEQPILELIKNGLQKDGHLVTGYTSAEQVPLDKLNRYDLVILDVMMPGTDGYTGHYDARNRWFFVLRKNPGYG